MTDYRRNARWFGGLPMLVPGVLAFCAGLALVATAGPARAGEWGAPGGFQDAGFQPSTGLFPDPYVPALEPMDRDGDGVMDDLDAFPLDPSESIDLDGDGVGDNADAYPLDPLRYSKRDADLGPDPADAVPVWRTPR
jgi:hypothetical protein